MKKSIHNISKRIKWESTLFFFTGFPVFIYGVYLAYGKATAFEVCGGLVLGIWAIRESAIAIISTILKIKATGKPVAKRW